MALFRRKATQIEFAVAIFEFIRQARFCETAASMLPKDTPKPILDKFVRAEIYLVLVSTINFYPDKSLIVAALIRLIFQEVYKEEFISYEKFRAFFDEDIQGFERILHFGEKTGNGMLYGISKWVYDEPKGNVDLIGQMQITPHLAAVYDQISKTHKANQGRYKIVD